MVDVVKWSKPFDLTAFSKAIAQKIESVKTTLITSWYESLRDTFNRGLKKKHVPDVSRPKALSRFFNCVAALMTRNLQDICAKSSAEFTDYICDPKMLNGSLQLHVLLASANRVTYHPSFNEIEKQLLRIVNKIVEVIPQFPRLETKVYLDNINSVSANLQPYVPPESIETCQQRIHNFLEQQNKVPVESFLTGFY